MVCGVLTGALVVFPVLLAAPGNGTFRAPLLVPHSFGTAVAIAPGDFDGDGEPELALARGDSRIVVLRWTEEPREAWRETWLPPVGEGCYALRAADLDGDGDDDLAVADPSTTVHVVLSAGDGSFEDPEPIASVPGPRSLAVGDWNRDGTLDLATANHPSASVSVLLGEGGGSFRLTETITVGAFHHNHDIVSLDYDGDGALDLLVAVDLTGLQPLRGLGDGRFDVRPEIRGLMTEPLHLVAADLDHDGLDDVIASGRGLYSACVGLSRSGGAFERTAVFEGTWAAPALADLDGDGLEDLLLARTEERRLEFHAGDGTGRFLEPTRYPLALVEPAVVAAVDVDRDARDDVIVADSGYDGLIVARGAEDSLPPRLGWAASGFEGVGDVELHDLDGNGSLDVWVAQRGGDLVVLPGEAIGRGASLATMVPAPILVEGCTGMLDIAVLDLDQDGVPDVVGTTADPFFFEGSVLVAFLDRSARVARKVVLDRGLAPTALRAGRLDDDDVVDLAAAFAGTDEISVILGGDGGTFSEARRVPTVLSPRGFETVDVDGDGHTDLVAWSAVDVAVHFGRGDGSFTPPEALAVGVVKGIRDVAVVDAYGDGLRQLFVCDGLGGRILGFRVGPNRQPRLETVLNPGPTRLDSLDAADLDGDGLPELTVTSPSERTVLVLENRGSGGLEVARRYAVGSPRSHALVDVDLDGARDIVAVYPEEIVVFPGNRDGGGEPRLIRGDVDSDGQVNITDGLRLLNVLFLGGEPPSCLDAADIDDSGDVNLTDAVRVLDHLFLGGSPLPPPHPACGVDPTADELGCLRFDACR